MTQLFDPADSEHETNEPESYFEAMVGEGKKYADAEALAKSRAAAEEYVKRLEKENEEARQELQRRLTAEELLEKMSASRNRNETERDNDDDDDSRSFNPDQIKGSVIEEVKKLLEQEQQKSRALRNVESVETELKKVWGSDYKARLSARAKELSLEPAYLGKLAEDNPQAFLKIVVPRQNNSPVAPPRSSASGYTAPTEGVRNYEYYQKMRKEDPKRYWSRQTQIDIHRDAVALGPDFYKSK